jgi:anti-repressor protein
MPHDTGASARSDLPAIFTFPVTGQSVRTITITAEPWFVAADVAEILDLGNLHSSLAQLDEDERSLHTVERGQRSMSVVSEPGLYSLILRSRKPQAKEFKRWITHVVLPTIRKTGGYLAPTVDLSDPAQLVRIMQTGLDAAKQLQEANEKIAELEPSAGAWDALASTGRDYSAREAAYILNRDPAITTGQNLLLGKIRQFRMVDPFDRPYSDHKAHLTLRPQSYTDSDGALQDAKPQLRITYAGLRYLHKRLGGTGQLQIEMGEAR